MIPTNGCVYSIRLLGSVALVQQRRSVDDWLDAAKFHGTYLAAANNLRGWALFMLQNGLANQNETVELSPRAEAVVSLDAKRGQYELARLLLLIDPPAWIQLAVEGRTVRREYIPQDDLRDLRWLEPRLDELLIDVAGKIAPPDTDFLDRLGRAGEYVVMAALKHCGLRPRHVALLSDSYGYDVEALSTDGGVDRIEVKAAGRGTAGQFHLSRNEFDKSVMYGPEWRVIRVVFNGEALVASRLDCSHIDSIHELNAATLRALVPFDSSSFQWETSALLSPTGDDWVPLSIRPAPDFWIEGFGTL